MYVRSLKIENLRCFRRADLQLQYPGRADGVLAPEMPNINLLLGTNGAGKTTTLKAIALAALSPVITQAGYVPYRLVRRTDTTDTKFQSARVEAELLLHGQDVGSKEQATIPIEKLATKVVRHGDTESLVSETITQDPSQTDGIWRNMYLDKSPAFLIVGYGATRRVEDSGSFETNSLSKSRLLRYQRVAGLFEGAVALRPLAGWLPEFKKRNPGRATQVINLIDRLLPEGTNFKGLFERGEYLFHLGRTKIPFGALSDGYRAYIGWVADLLYHICVGAPKGATLVENRGVVLVDEIDLHLHPEWQRNIVSLISKTLPNLQFVFTTHSPIIAGSLHRENIYVMEAKRDGSTSIRKFEERIYGKDADQVLTSSYFNLPTTRAPGFVDELQHLSQSAGLDNPEVSLAIMRKLSGTDAETISTNGGVESKRVSVTKRKSRTTTERSTKTQRAGTKVRKK